MRRFALFALIFSLAACGARLGGDSKGKDSGAPLSPEAGAPQDSATNSGNDADALPAPDGGAADAAADADADALGLIWPNAESSANSDPWLREHHDDITEMRPRALILHFANGNNVNAIMARWNLMVQAFTEASTYHGYKDPNAKPFVRHQLAKLVDLTDRVPPPGWTAPNSTQMPRLNGGIDFSKLYNQTYADLYGFADPDNPGHNLTLCELIQKGVINELFIAFNKTGSDGNVPEIIEYKQRYAINDFPIAGQFDPNAGNGSFDPADLPEARACGRSLRVDFIEMTGIISGAMHVFTHNLEHLGTALPNYKRFFMPFFNMDFTARFATPFNDWYGISINGEAADFISYTGTNAAHWVCPADSGCAGQQGMFSPFDQGCGNTHYAPNSRNSYDMGNMQMVLTRCEHYGLQDGPDGKDLQTPYNAATVAAQAAKYGSDGNGGGWQVYMMQNLPAYHSGAKLPDGTPIKNFWPYLYY